MFTDEYSCTVQLEQYSRLCFKKRLQPRLLKQRAKHPINVHIWGGISARGATIIIMFTGIMDAELLSTVLEAGLLPSLRSHYPTPTGHHLQQDNDPKHGIGLLKTF